MWADHNHQLNWGLMMEPQIQKKEVLLFVLKQEEFSQFVEL